jgi:undecaprenyl diphosphate synthase
MLNYNTFHPNASTGIRHIGLIPDGGRRWAENNNHSLLSSYGLTSKKMAEFVILLAHSGIAEISIFLSSKENFRRHENETDAFNSAAMNAIQNTIPQMAMRHKIKVSVAGETSQLNAEFIEEINKLEYSTRNFDLLKLNLLISYNPVDEIKHAINQSDSEDFTKNLWVKTPLDLVIRTGGANLLSNFLPIQAGYARLYFSNKLFNDFTLTDLMEYIDNYTSLTRKYGE